MSLKKKLYVFMVLPLLLFISIFYSLWLVNTVNTYIKLSFHFPASTPSKILWKVGVIEYYQLLNKIKITNTQTDYKILIDNKYIEELNSNIPYSGISEYKNAYLINQNTSEVFKGKARYRGDSAYHWLFDKKSWRFKTTKKKLVNGRRKVNFIITKGNEVLNNHLSYKFSSLLGLLTPHSEIVSLSINDSYNGLKVLTEQVDESFLRNNRRMPNDIYVGDNVLNSHFMGVPNKLLTSPNIWDKASYNNHYDKGNLVPLGIFIDNIKMKNFNNLSLEDFAKFSTLLSLTGSLHVDNIHNWKIYYDNYYEKFYPITWDLVGWYKTHRNEIDKINSIRITDDIMRSLFSSYQFLYLRQKEFVDFFNNKEDVIELVEKETESALSKITSDGFTLDIHHNLMTNKNTINEIHALKDHIIKWLGNLENIIFSPGEYKWNYKDQKIVLDLNGRSIVNKIKIELYDKIAPVKESYIYYKFNGSDYRIDVSQHLKTNENILTYELPLFSNMEENNKHELVFSNATYKLEIDGVIKENIKNIEFELLDLNNTSVAVNKVFNIKEHEMRQPFELIGDKNTNKTVVWSGIKVFSGFNVFDEDIIIEKGTKLIFDHNATVKVLGKVLALGTADSPIIFEAKNITKPWGAFVLKDKGANNSKFTHCHFSGGSGSKGEMHEYTGFLSIHNVKDVVFNDCIFSNSYITDDMLHVIYSDVKFRNSTFSNSLSDALDADISNIIIDSCTFTNNGNDSVDLMTSNAVVINTLFENSKDKGISIGEGSKLLAINNYIKSNEIGMQSKDTSKAYIYNSTFKNNKKAIDAYHKNWRYEEGGSIYVSNSKFDNNINTATTGKRSNILINNSMIDKHVVFDEKDIAKNKIIITKKNLTKGNFEGGLFDMYDSLIRESVIGNYE